ncbi:MAG TPA: hypothetical protein P5210_01400 [Draconibacterium sp.]|nr:hypothetical protein [Draconibacterium sp.]HRX10268.1 hypothetical protein [Draconibacterium sp.]
MHFRLPVCILLISIIFFSCNKEEFNFSTGAKLQFASDTVTFDTVFSTIGSTTKWFTVKNPNKQSVKISKIFLAGGSRSQFRLNINGVQSNEDFDVTISAGDSLFVFVEVTIDPTRQNNPMVVQDSIVFNLNGNTQDVDLIAFGQDFHLLNGEVLKTQRWENDKPYLIYNSVLVDSLETLNIDPGCRIHFHYGSGLFVKGTLKATGTFEEPISFQGDRLEESYKNIPGQWGAYTEFEDGSLYVYGGIHFLVGSKDNLLDYSLIKNAVKGIQIDSMGFSENPVLTISNSRIENMSLNCIDARTTFLKASNVVFANSGSYTVALRFGGDYEFNHCTIANYSDFGNRKEPSLLLKNYYEYNKITYSFSLNAIFGNCIIYGNRDNEILTDKGGAEPFTYLFKNCLVNTNLSSGFENPVFNKDPRFVNISENNFAIDSLSPARNIGDIEIAKRFPIDLDNYSRLEDEGADLGALEWIPVLKRRE